MRARDTNVAPPRDGRSEPCAGSKGLGTSLAKSFRSYDRRRTLGNHSTPPGRLAQDPPGATAARRGRAHGLGDADIAGADARRDREARVSFVGGARRTHRIAGSRLG